MLHTLPIIKGMVGIAKTMGNMFQLLQGYSAETSGGLLMSISAERAKAFSEEILALEGQPAWVIGTVEVHKDFCFNTFFVVECFPRLSFVLNIRILQTSGRQWESQNCGQSDNNGGVAVLLQFLGPSSQILMVPDEPQR